MVRALRFAVVLAATVLSTSGSAPRRTTQVTYWPTGQVQSRTPQVDGRADGWARAWYADGQPMWVRGYTAGRETGVHTGWWPDGTRKFRLAYVDGLLEGASHEWYVDGSPFRDSNYHRGQETGLQRMYDADGAVRASYEVRGGRRYGSIGAVGCTPKRATDG